MAEPGGRLRGGRRPHLRYARCYGTYKPDRMGGLVPQDWRYSSADIYHLAEVDLADVDVLLIPGNHDQLFMRSIEPRLVAYLAAGGHLLVNGHITEPWLPCLSPFKAVSPRPFTNWMIRPMHPGAYFGRMDFETFHR
jgi:hypothetical protein